MCQVALLAALLFAGLGAALFAGLAAQIRSRLAAEHGIRGRVEALHEGAGRLEPYQDTHDVHVLLRFVHAVEVSAQQHPAREGGVRLVRVGGIGRGADDETLLVHAGLSWRVDREALVRVCRFTLFLGATVCGVLAFAIAPALAPLGVVVGVAAGCRWPRSVLARTARSRREAYERELPFMLNILSLCLQTGMSFDAALDVFCRRFDSALAHDCERMRQRYQQGIETRDESLGWLAGQVDLVALDRFVEATTQALHFGAPLGEVMGELAEESRKEYRARVSEQIAKAPVRMLVPTGTLILPAMLLLVLGPVLLNLVGEMM